MASGDMTMTVVTNSPFTVLADGADTPCPAEVLDTGTGYAPGDRAQVTVRTPQLPLVTGKVVPYEAE